MFITSIKWSKSSLDIPKSVAVNPSTDGGVPGGECRISRVVFGEGKFGGAPWLVNSDGVAVGVLGEGGVLRLLGGGGLRWFLEAEGVLWLSVT